jgi:hypothetical protein
MYEYKATVTNVVDGDTQGMNLRKAAQQALEALEEYQAKGAPFWACDGAVAALRTALSEDAMERLTDVQQEMDCYGDGNVYRGQRSSDSKTPTLTINGMPAVEGPLSKSHRTCQESRQVEPVAWTTKGQISAMENGFQHYIHGRVPRFVSPTEDDVPLYAAPPKREPLSDGQIARLCGKFDARHSVAIGIAREIERAHGIGGRE